MRPCCCHLRVSRCSHACVSSCCCPRVGAGLSAAAACPLWLASWYPPTAPLVCTSCGLSHGSSRLLLASAAAQPPKCSCPDLPPASNYAGRQGHEVLSQTQLIDADVYVQLCWQVLDKVRCQDIPPPSARPRPRATSHSHAQGLGRCSSCGPPSHREVATCIQALHVALGCLQVQARRSTIPEGLRGHPGGCKYHGTRCVWHCKEPVSSRGF